MRTGFGRRVIKDKEHYRHLSFPPLSTPYSGALPHWLEGGIERRETYTGAVLGLLFLYRLGKDKIDAPFPRGTGSFEKLKKKRQYVRGSIFVS